MKFPLFRKIYLKYVEDGTVAHLIVCNTLNDRSFSFYSVINPNICPLCVTSILDYEAHMREAHQKQPCPICGYVFDTNIPLYVMTYHIERHLEDVEESLHTQ